MLHVHADDLERCYLTPNCLLVCDDDINIFDFCTIKTMLGKERTLDKNCGLPGVGVYIGTSNPYMLLLLAPYLFTWYFLEKRWCVPVFSFKCLCACTHSKHAQHTLCACTYITCNLSLWICQHNFLNWASYQWLCFCLFAILKKMQFHRKYLLIPISQNVLKFDLLKRKDRKGTFSTIATAASI